MAKEFSPAVPTYQRLVQPAKRGRFTERTFAAIDPDGLASILRQVDQGYMLEQYADLAEWICEDDRVSSVVDTKLDSVASMPFDVKPGRAMPGQEAVAEQAAEMCREMLLNTDRLVQLFEDLLNAAWLGYSAAEHNWTMDQDLWVSRPHVIRPRDIEFTDDWHLKFRSYDANVGGYAYVRSDEHKNKFICFTTHRRGSTPLRAGLIRNVAWYWLFKRWALKFWISGAERLGTPPMMGKVGRDAANTARTSLKEGLENLSEGQAAILEEQTSIEFPDTGFATSADVWEKLVDKLNDAITMAVLGNIEVVDGGDSGSRARAEVGAKYAIDPRVQKLAGMLYEVIERDWFEPFLFFNADKFGGVVPPTPKLVPQEFVDSLDLGGLASLGSVLDVSNLVTKNEIRASLGAASLTPEQGGDQFMQAPTASPSPFGMERELSADGGSAPALPLAESNPNASSETRFGLTRNVALALGLSSESPKNSRRKPSPTDKASSRTSKRKPSTPSKRRKPKQLPLL